MQKCNETLLQKQNLHPMQEQMMFPDKFENTLVLQDMFLYAY